MRLADALLPMYQNILRGSAYAVVLSAIVSSTSFAATINFTGGGPNDLWSTAANWDFRIPQTDDFVNIADSSQAVEVAQSGAVAEYIDIYGGGTLNVTGGDLTFGHSNGGRWIWIGFLSQGTVNQSGGSVSSVGNNGDVVIDNFGTYNMTAGSLQMSDDLWMLDGGLLTVAGQSSLTVGDDFRIPGGQAVTIQVNLVGDTVPDIIVEDDLRMGGDVSLEIDTSLWTGPDEFELFQVNDQVNGQFSSVTIDGVPQDPNDFQFNNGSVTIPVVEPSAHAMAGLAAICLFLGLAPALGRRIPDRDEKRALLRPKLRSPTAKKEAGGSRVRGTRNQRSVKR